MTYRLTPSALRDLDGIQRYLTSEASAETAERIETKLFAAFDDLARLPPVGHRRSDVDRRGVLFHLLKPYMIAFRRDAHQVIIIRVLHGRRNIAHIVR